MSFCVSKVRFGRLSLVSLGPGGEGPKLIKLNLPNLTLDTQNDMCSISTSDSDCIVTVTQGAMVRLGQVR